MDHLGSKKGEISGIAFPDLLAGIWRAGQVWIGAERLGGQRRVESADRDWTRSSGLRIGGFPVSGDRSHEGWLGCDRRLAAAECAGEYRQRRELGFDSQWRRCGNWILATCGAGGLRRWYPGDGEAHRTSADQRPRNGRSAARGCRLSRSGGLREEEWRESADDGE